VAIFPTFSIGVHSIHHVSLKKEPEQNSAYFDNHKFKLYKNHSKHVWIIVHYDYKIHVVGFLTVLCRSR